VALAAVWEAGRVATKAVLPTSTAIPAHRSATKSLRFIAEPHRSHVGTTPKIRVGGAETSLENFLIKICDDPRGDPEVIPLDQRVRIANTTRLSV
jgi:hypothetical protein